MQRRFREHFLRRVHPLDGVWDFAFLGDVDAELVDVANLDFDDVMTVPGCFDATPKYAGARGVAAYRTRIAVGRAGRLRWHVGAAHHRAKLFVERRVLRGHGGGFTPFFGDFHLPAAAELELVVLVDNRFDDERSPLHLEKFDWYQYGGLSRSTELHELPGIHIDGVEATPVSTNPPTLDVVVRFGAAAVDFGRPTELCFTWNGELLSREEVRIEAPQGALRRRFVLPHAELWSPSHPSLHLLGVQLGQDDQFTRVGMRTLAFDRRGLLVNGEVVRLRGVNRHEAHPLFGHATPPQLQLSDLHLIRDLGCNFLRGSHYPQDPVLLDLCDELGLLVWNEAIGWQHGIEDLRHPHFVDAQLQHIEEMVSSSINHPSVVLFGVLNESASNQQDARPTYKKLISYLRERDPSRPVTFASNRHGSDQCLDLVDLVSVNAYPGWYFGDLSTATAELDRILSLYRAAAPDKPILISEIGAGAIYGQRDHHEQRWSEEFQAKLLHVLLEHMESPACDSIGVCLWQFADCRTTERLETALGRPRGFNNKGLFDEYRRPKLAARIVRDHFHRSSRKP